MKFTNKHLKSSIAEIGNFLKNNTKPPEDMYINLLLELKVSNLFIPIVFDGENVSFPHIEVDDGTKLLPLFTSEEELKKYSTDFDWLANEIAYYIALINDLDFDGILIDLASDEFCIEKEIINRISVPDLTPQDRGFSPQELKELALAQTNEGLKDFIRNPSNFNNFDELSELLESSCLLNAVVSEEDLSCFAKNGIINRQDASTFTLFTTESGRDFYGTVYTDIDEVIRFHEKLEYYYYAQVTNKYIVFNFLLSHDFEGLIINPGSDEYFVPRQVLLRLLNEDLISPDLENATAYAFIIER